MSLQSKTFADLVNFARASTATYVDADGTIKTAAVDAPRFDWSTGRRALLLEASATNLMTSHVNPTTTAGFTKTGDAAGVLSVVDDTAALAAAGLASIVSTGKVYKADNSAGATEMWVNSGAVVGVTGSVAMQLRYRGGGGETSIYLSGQSTNRTVLNSSVYTRATKVSVATVGTQNLVIRVTPGVVLYFTMVQLEVGSAATSYIPTSGTAVTRAADIASIKGLTAGTFDRRLVTPSGTADTSGVVHPGGDIALAPGAYYQSIYYPGGTL